MSILFITQDFLLTCCKSLSQNSVYSTFTSEFDFIIFYSGLFSYLKTVGWRVGGWKEF